MCWTDTKKILFWRRLWHIMNFRNILKYFGVIDWKMWKCNKLESKRREKLAIIQFPQLSLLSNYSIKIFTCQNYLQEFSSTIEVGDWRKHRTLLRPLSALNRGHPNALRFVMYHIHKDSWSWMTRTNPKKWLTFINFHWWGRPRTQLIRVPPDKNLVFLTNLFFLGETG